MENEISRGGAPAAPCSPLPDGAAAASLSWTASVCPSGCPSCCPSTPLLPLLPLVKTKWGWVAGVWAGVQERGHGLGQAPSPCPTPPSQPCPRPQAPLCHRQACPCDSGYPLGPQPLPRGAPSSPLPLPHPRPWLPLPSAAPRRVPLETAPRRSPGAFRGGSAGNIKQVQPLQSPFERGQSRVCSRHGEPSQAQRWGERGRLPPGPRTAPPVPATPAGIKGGHGGPGGTQM